MAKFIRHTGLLTRGENNCLKDALVLNYIIIISGSSSGVEHQLPKLRVGGPDEFLLLEKLSGC